MAKNSIILAYITCKNRNGAKRIASHLLNKRLIACANILPIDSMYRWKSKIEKGKEAVLIAKSTPKHFASIKNEVKRIHSYKTPCILKIGAKANPEFETWIREEVRE